MVNKVKLLMVLSMIMGICALYFYFQYHNEINVLIGLGCTTLQILLFYIGKKMS